MSTEETRVTEEAAKFVADLTYTALPPEAVRIGKRCVLDGLGLILAGSFEKCTRILMQFGGSTSQPGKASVLGANPMKLTAPFAALINGTAGHAMDWDDSQLSISPDRIYGLLTHPTIPPLTAACSMEERAASSLNTSPSDRACLYDWPHEYRPRLPGRKPALQVSASAGIDNQLAHGIMAGQRNF